MSGRDNAAEIVAGILDSAARRGHEERLPYAGLVTPQEAWRLQQAGAARIVDVRSRPEWELVGRVPDSVLLEWRRYGERTPNPDFVASLEGAFPRHATLLFLCRSAVRSHHAAAAAARAGFAHSFNVLEGFEGDPDFRHQRGHTGGWRKAGLPWLQD
jgi:rhodanese-related sulfurtransferase